MADKPNIIDRTPNSECPSCQKKELHRREEYKFFHPLGGHGANKEQGPCCRAMAGELGLEWKGIGEGHEPNILN